MNKIRVGLIGCGAISERHFEAINSLKEFELVAVSDVVAKKAEKAGKEYKTLLYSKV